MVILLSQHRKLIVWKLLSLVTGLSLSVGTVSKPSEVHRRESLNEGGPT